MADKKPVSVPTQLYAIEIYDAKTDQLFHVMSHPVRATRDTMAVHEAAREYRFNSRHWLLRAVPAEFHFH